MSQTQKLFALAKTNSGLSERTLSSLAGVNRNALRRGLTGKNVSTETLFKVLKFANIKLTPVKGKPPTVNQGCVRQAPRNPPALGKGEITVEDAAAEFEVSEFALYRRIWSGDLEARTLEDVGWKYAVRLADVKDCLDDIRSRQHRKARA